jgi:hypothetical protein
VLWAAKAAKMGYRRRIENGRKVRFWEDLWFRTCSLTIQFWEIYSIINEPGTTVREAWDGLHLRFTFKRTVDNRTLNLWHEVVQIASSIQYSKKRMSLYGSLLLRVNIRCRPYMMSSNKFILLSCGKYLYLPDYIFFYGF